MTNRRAGTALLAAFALAAPLIVSQAQTTLLFTIFLLAYICVAWNMVAGFVGQLSLAHGAFFGIGALGVASLAIPYGITPYLGVFVGIAAACLYALLIGWVAFRRGVSGLYFALLTLSFAYVAQALAREAPVLENAAGAFFPPAANPAMFVFGSRLAYYYAMLGLLAAIVALAAWISRSRYGYYWRAIKQNEQAAAALGIDPFRHKCLALVVSAGLTAVGGAFHTVYFLYFEPDLHFGLPLQINVILATIIGGVGTVWGPVFGAAFIETINFAFRAMPLPSQTMVVVPRILVGILMAIIIFVRPQGLVTLLRRRRPGEPPPPSGADDERGSSPPAPAAHARST